MQQEKYQTLIQLIKIFTKTEGSFSPTPIANLNLCRRNHSTKPMPCIYPLSLFFVVQGSQHLNYGEKIMHLKQGDTVLTTLDLPLVSNVQSANQDKPYLSLRIELDMMMLRELYEQIPPETQPIDTGDTLSVLTADDDLFDAVYRYVKLLEQPELQPYLRPLIEKEICVRLLLSQHSAMLKKILTAGTVEQNIAKIIAYFNEHYAEKIEIAQLAKTFYMSGSSLRTHFKKITGQNPLQYLKELRLQNARRLMFKENHDATTAAFAVGYESPSQFSREYTRLFGKPPLKDIQRLKTDEMHFGKIV